MMPLVFAAFLAIALDRCIHGRWPARPHRPRVLKLIGQRALRPWRHPRSEEMSAAELRADDTDYRRPPPTGYHDHNGVYHPSPASSTYEDHADGCARCDEERRRAS